MTKLFGDLPDKANEPPPPMPPAAARPQPGSRRFNRVLDVVIIALILTFIVLVHSIMVESA